ncbi:glucosyltransferase - Alg8p [Moesziomyces antarcticus T-34]|uniref:Alpha-1,3-glucosyltransferase n=1 Tax=Pseudozyma antarctica (strain T-34) TaxID=1151754 RepID=M9M1E6_PSEA3|nr:glucosyltransferase - Alg8p [Moesziomyces antarcticus T-34]
MSPPRIPRSPSMAAEVIPPALAGPTEHGTSTKEATTTTLGLLKSEWELLTLSTAVKLLLFPTYHSTDFEVHRNWLAITRSLPMRDWYFEATSQWTLDYPPFFAYFSWILAQPAALVDPLIVSLHEGLEYSSWSCKAYMRATVIATELVLAAALLAHARIGTQRTMKIGYADSTTAGPSTSYILAASLLMHPGLIIIDHIHFQYNGFLFGVLAWSLWAAREDHPLLCAFLFSSLLNLKHIYVYVAPPFLVFLLRSYVVPVGTRASDVGRCVERLITVGVVTLIPFVLSLAPLALDGLRHEAGPLGVLAQMVKRLFPFSRGLIHAYWAPNAWALWTFADRVLVKLLPRVPALRMFVPAGMLARFDASAGSGFASASRGLVENIAFGIMPDISPSMCFALTLTCMCVYMVKLWQTPTYRSFLAAVSLCGFASFLFGWHVHEKAIMLPLIPYTLLAAVDYAHLRTFVLLSAAGIVSLFPLLFTPQEAPIKIACSIVWALLVLGPLQKRVFRPVQSNLGLVVHRLESLYLWGFVALQAYVSIVHPMIFAQAGHSVVLPVQPVLASPANATHASAAAAHMASDAIPLPPATAIADSAAVQIDADPPLPVATPDSNADGADEAVAVDTAEFDVAPPTSDSISRRLLSTPTAPDTPSTGSIQDQPEATATTSKVQELTPSESSMEFLPLMMVSVYCSLGVIWAWMRASAVYLLSEA